MPNADGFPRACGDGWGPDPRRVHFPGVRPVIYSLHIGYICNNEIVYTVRCFPLFGILIFSAGNTHQNYRTPD